MPNRFNAVLFDIDNVLVDTRFSYLAAIQKTVEIYLGRPGVITPKEIDQFKLLGGFNDDWDCSYGIIAFLETARVSISELREIFPERPLGAEGLLKRLRVLYDRVKTPSYKRVAQIFQKVYLGKKKGKGLIRKEKLIFPKTTLKKIADSGTRLGIVTGRNRFEARYALKRFGILKFFDVVVTIDEVRREEKRKGKLLRKPNPWSILEAGRLLRKKLKSPLNLLYVGDLPDDILAAKKAVVFLKIKSVAFPKYARDLRATLAELRRVKPDYILKRPKDLLPIILSL